MDNSTTVEDTITTKAHTPSKWGFWLFWLGANALGFSLAYIIISPLFYQMVVNALFPGGISQTTANQVSLALSVLSAVIVGLAQWVVLRTWLKQAHWWLAATALGWIILTLVTTGEITAFRSAASSQVSLLARFIGLLSFVAYGVILGVVQWLILRLERPQSRDWIGWSVLGTAVSTTLIFLPITILASLPSPSTGVMQFLASLNQVNSDLALMGVFRLVQWGIVAAVTGIGLFAIISRPSEQYEAKAQASPWGRFLLYWSLWTLLALFINSYFAPNFLSFWTALQSDPNLHALVVDLFMGVMVGVLQWLVLREHFKNAYLWILATILGYALIGINQNLLTILYPDTSFLSLGSAGDVLRSVTYFLTGSLGFWILLGAFQAGALVYWLGKKAWIWVLAVPAIQIVGLLANLFLWVPIGHVIQAVGSGLWLIYIIRSGLLEDVYFASQTEMAPSSEELELAAQILQERMASSWAIQGQATVEAGQLKVEVASRDDANDVTDLAMQQGKAVFFKAVAGATLEDGAPLPEDAKAVLTEDDIEYAEAFEPAANEQPGVEIKLTSEGKQKLEQAWNKDQPLHLGLALDGEVVAVLELDKPDAEGIYPINPFSLDENFLAAILDNDPLPFPLKTAEEPEEEEEKS